MDNMTVIQTAMSISFLTMLDGANGAFSPARDGRNLLTSMGQDCYVIANLLHQNDSYETSFLRTKKAVNSPLPRQINLKNQTLKSFKSISSETTQPRVLLKWSTVTEVNSGPSKLMDNIFFKKKSSWLLWVVWLRQKSPPKTEPKFCSELFRNDTVLAIIVFSFCNYSEVLGI